MLPFKSWPSTDGERILKEYPAGIRLFVFIFVEGNALKPFFIREEFLTRIPRRQISQIYFPIRFLYLCKAEKNHFHHPVL